MTDSMGRLSSSRSRCQPYFVYEYSAIFPGRDASYSTSATLHSLRRASVTSTERSGCESARVVYIPALLLGVPKPCRVSTNVRSSNVMAIAPKPSDSLALGSLTSV